jgi:MFS family permease
MLAYWVIFSWVPKYLKLIHFSDASIGWWMLCAQLGAFIGYLSFGFIADWSGKFRTTFAGYTLVFALGVQIFIHGNTLANRYLSLLGIFLTGLGTGFFSGYGPLYCKLFPTRIRNTSASWCFNMGRLGSFIAPIMVAEIASGIGFGGALSLASIFAIFACCWIFLITRDDLGGIHFEYESNSQHIHISQN